MPILGAVLTMSSRPDERLETLRCLAADARLELGEPSGARLPVVIETTSRGEDRDCWASFYELPGVRHVELAFADFSDLVEDGEEER